MARRRAQTSRSFKWFLRRPKTSKRRKEGRVFLQVTERASFETLRHGRVARPTWADTFELRVGDEMGFDCEATDGRGNIERWKVRFTIVPEPT